MKLYQLWILEENMEFYKKLYFTLFAKVEDALVQLDAALDGGETPDLPGVYRARKIFAAALQDAEDTYIEADDMPAADANAVENLAQIIKALTKLTREERKALFQALHSND